jgi:hypothetical protein
VQFKFVVLRHFRDTPSDYIALMPYIQGFAPFHGWPTRMSVPTAAYVFLVILQPLEMFIDLPSLYNFISYVASFLSGIPLSGGLAR